MDELDALRGFRSDIAPANEATRISARAALASSIERATDTAPRRRGWVTPRRMVPLAIAAAIALLMMVAGPLLNNGAPASSAAAKELNAVADVALKQVPDTALRGTLDGEFVYTRSESISATLMVNADGGPTVGALVPITREFWLAADGSGRIRQVAGTASPLGDTDPALVAQLGASMDLDQTYLAGELSNPLAVLGRSNDELIQLAGDPEALMAALREVAEASGKPIGFEEADTPPLNAEAAADRAAATLDYRVFTLIGDLLRESSAPPVLRAALYRAVADLDGVELLGQVTDDAGRTGVAVAITRDGTSHELIFDANTSALLEERDVLTESSTEWGNAPAGTVIGQTTFLTTCLVDSTDAIP